MISSCIAVSGHADVVAADDARLDYIDRLIERLGSLEYAQREKARIELMELGADAFDALNRARAHEDVEVRKQAEYLIRAIRIVWVQDDDDPQVKELLRNYRTSSLDDRESRLNRLARVENGAGIEPLCRLVRFETSENLSKRAALLVMNSELRDREDGTSWDETIENVIRSSQRPAAQWLRLYARHLRNPNDTFEEWDELATAEENDAQEHPDKVRLVVLRDFLRWQVDSLEREGRRQDAIRMMWRTLDVQDATNAELLGTVDWLIERSAWELIDVLSQKFEDTFNTDPKLVYRQAEANRRLGDEQRAQELAEAAIQLVKDQPQLHIEIAQDLQTRGLIDWAENEYQRLIDKSEPISAAGFDARIRLGWMLHDLARNKQAYETLRDLVEIVDKDNEARRVLAELERDLPRIRGQMHFSHALYLGQQEKWDEQVKALESAIRFDQYNADIMIAMFHVPHASEAFVQRTRNLIRTMAKQYRAAAITAERNYQSMRNEDSRERFALMLNQYAWLVSNTEGDYKTALESSKRSLELMPDDPGYLDTLARCHYAVGDYASAVARQLDAVRGDPHSGQIQRQLALFEKALADQKAGKKPNQNSND